MKSALAVTIIIDTAITGRIAIIIGRVITTGRIVIIAIITKKIASQRQGPPKGGPCFVYGAEDEGRTRDLLLGKEALCH